MSTDKKVPILTPAGTALSGAADTGPPTCGFCGQEAGHAYDRYPWFEHYCHSYSHWIEQWANKESRAGQKVVPLLCWNPDGSPMDARDSLLKSSDLAALFLDKSVVRATAKTLD